MRAIKVRGRGDAVVDSAAPVPVPGPGYLLIKVHSVALNPTDWKGVASFDRDEPHTGGCDAAGTLVAFGEGCKQKYRLGDRLAGLCIGLRSGAPTSGAFGEYALLKEALSLQVPDHISDEEASTLPVGINVVGQSLYQTLKLPQPGSVAAKHIGGPSVLIYGGATATGMFAIQYARLSGCHVLTTCSQKNFRLVQALGAHEVFDYHDAGACAAGIREATRDNLQYAFDCHVDESSMQICAGALTSRPGIAIYTAVLPVAGRFPRSDVEHGWRSGYTAFGEEWHLLGKVQPAVPEDLAFATGFWELTEQLLYSDRLRLKPLVRSRRGGLSGISQGLTELRWKQGEPGKLVYTLSDEQDHFAHLQDVLGQLPFLKTYSHLMLCFPLHREDEQHSQKAVAEALHTAALAMLKSFPWLAAKVVEDDGVYKARPCLRWTEPNTILRSVDRSKECARFDKIVAARGPISMLDGLALAPRRAFPESYEESDDNPAPVLAFQANFVDGGLLLDCAAQHNLIDMSGIEQCFKLLAMAMRGEQFPAAAIEQGNRERGNIVPLLGPAETMADHSQFLRDAALPRPAPTQQPASPFSWRYFRFTKQKVDELKRLAMSSLPSASEHGTWISSNDALSAFCWQRIGAARLSRRQRNRSNDKVGSESGEFAARAEDVVVKFCRALNGRAALGIPTEYMGDVVTIAMSHSTLGALTSAPLGSIASQMRQDVSRVNTRDYIRSFATFIASTPDKTRISYGGNFNPDTDIGCSSWAHLQLSTTDFGPLLGRPSLVRRPDFAPLPSDIYFMPQTADGDLDALLCFNEADFAALAADEQWLHFTEYIG